MVAMTDFCVRYTALVDGGIAKLTKSLRDSCEHVRRQAFILLARLLQRDYVKWKGMLFHRFLLALVDESEKIRQLADFLFGSVLKTKAPLLAYNSFVEAIFILNDCHLHASHIEALQTSEAERHLFSLRGNNEAVCLKRMHIYVSLLKQMQPSIYWQLQLSSVQKYLLLQLMVCLISTILLHSVYCRMHCKYLHARRYRFKVIEQLEG